MLNLNFLQGFMKLTEGTEIPPAFSLWSGIAAVSAAMARNSWLKLGPFTIYPNLFVLLVGASGVRKTSGIVIAQELLRKMEPGPNLLAQKQTPEALIQSIRQVETKDMTRLLAEQCTGFVVADEMSTFLNKRSYEQGLASLLISLYDCHDKFEYKTVGRGSEMIVNACLGLLAGSTVDWIRSGIPEESVGGGLTSRILFVYVDQPAAPVPIPEWTEQHELLQGRLLRQLMEISRIKGDFQITQEARDEYSREYLEWRTNTGKPFEADKSLSGYANRRMQHILKLSMVLSACDQPDKVIKKNHIVGATHMVAYNERFLKHVLSLITSNQHGSDVQAVYNFIARSGRATRSDLVRAMSNKMTSRQLTEILDGLLVGGQIQTIATSTGTFYVITTQG